MDAVFISPFLAEKEHIFMSIHTMNIKSLQSQKQEILTLSWSDIHNILYYAYVEKHFWEGVYYLESLGFSIFTYLSEYFIFSEQWKWIKLYNRYKNVRQKTEKKAIEKIITWWIPICYDPQRQTGKNMAEKSYNTFLKNQNLFLINESNGI